MAAYARRPHAVGVHEKGRGAAREPMHVRAALEELLREMRPVTGANPAARLAQLGEYWRSAAGDAIADQSRVASYRGGLLVIDVATSPLLSELENFCRDRFTDALRSAGVTGLHDIRFRLARGGALRPKSAAGGRADQAPARGRSPA